MFTCVTKNKNEWLPDENRTNDSNELLPSLVEQSSALKVCRSFIGFTLALRTLCLAQWLRLSEPSIAYQNGGVVHVVSSADSLRALRGVSLLQNLEVCTKENGRR